MTAGLALDLRTAWRQTRASPAGSIAVVAILASAIAIATVLGSFFVAVISDVPPLDSPDSLVHIWRADETRPAGHREPSAGDFAAWKVDARTVTALTAWSRRDVVVGGADGRKAAALRVTSDYFQLAGRAPRLGRAFVPADFERNDVAIISDQLWRDRFDGDAAVIGRRLAVDAAPREIVGVMPPGFWLPDRGVDVWLPYVAAGPAIVDIAGRLAAGTTVAQAQSEFDVLAQRGAGAAGTARENRTLIRTFGDEARIRIGPGLRGFVAPAIALLIIACANVGNLLIIRMLTRQRELAIRVALGATRGRLARLSLAETGILGVAGGIAGFVLAVWGLELLRIAIAAAMPRLAGSLPLGRFVPLVAAIATATTMVGASMLPVWAVARGDVLSWIARRPRLAVGSRFRYGVGDVLVVLQVGLTVVLVVSTAMMIRIAAELNRQLRPVTGPDVYVARLVTRSEVNRRHQSSIYETILDEVARSGGVASASLTSEVPAPAGRPTTIVADAGAISGDCKVGLAFVSRTYFETLGLRLQRGTLPPSGTTAIVSATAARKCWNGSTSGEWRLQAPTAFGREWIPVAGVVDDLFAGPPPHNADLKIGDPALAWVVGANDWSSQAYLLVRPQAGTTPSATAITAAVNRASSAVAMEPMTRLEDVAREQIGGTTLVLTLFGVVAAIALVLAFTGVYAALSQSCSRRIVELGIRLAMGAEPRQLVTAAVARDLPLVAAGILAGITGTLWVTAIVWRDLLLVSATDPRLWLAVGGVLAVAALIASAGPALRAVRVDPIAVLRSE